MLRYELIRDQALTLDIAAWANDSFALTGAGEPVENPSPA